MESISEKGCKKWTRHSVLLENVQSNAEDEIAGKGVTESHNKYLKLWNLIRWKADFPLSGESLVD